MHRLGTWFRRSNGAAVVAAGMALLFFKSPADASQADWMRPEEISYPELLELSPESEKTAEAHALYLQSLFLEEERGPDAALATKRRVLFLAPAFTELAVDVAQHHLHRGETPEALSILKDAKKAAPHDSTPSLA
ncbi:MAG: hypothetical protein ACKOLA_16405, partial [Spartobacteria bacterium]